MNIHTAYFTLYIVVPIAGILLNGYVLWRLIRIARKNSVRFETSSALPLACMSVSDTITLWAQLVQAVFHSINKSFMNNTILDIICKIDIYLMHTTSAFSVWSWLALSVLRYTAVFHPIKYRTIWRQPRNALKALAISCCAFEVWILYLVVYSDDGRICTEDSSFSEHHKKLAHLMDIIMFYAIPSLLRIFFDGIVLFHCYNPFTMLDTSLYERRYAISLPSNFRRASRSSTMTDVDTVELRNNMALVMSISSVTSQGRTKKRQKFVKKKAAMVMRSIVISVLNLVLNLPSHIMRAWLTIDEDSGSNDLIPILEPISQILYFSQFACNAFYLSTSIYETTGTPRNTVIVNNGRQISRCMSNEEDDC
ncbi:unnamed protein product [Auanema sp. JU1783]|nr:unnamed protein product [Auanema sp. JU1783]